MTTYRRGDRFTDPDGRTLELVQRTDPRGDVPPYWSVRTVITVTGVDASTGQPTSEERYGRTTTVRENLLGTGYSPAEAPKL